MWIFRGNSGKFYKNRVFSSKYPFLPPPVVLYSSLPILHKLYEGRGYCEASLPGDPPARGERSLLPALAPPVAGGGADRPGELSGGALPGALCRLLPRALQRRPDGTLLGRSPAGGAESVPRGAADLAVLFSHRPVLAGLCADRPPGGGPAPGELL